MDEDLDIIERQRRHRESLEMEIVSKKAELKGNEDEIKALEWEYDFYFSIDRTMEHFSKLLTCDSAKIKIDGITLREKFWKAPYFGNRGRVELAQLILADCDEVCVRWNLHSGLKGEYYILSLGVLGDPCVKCPTGFSYCWAYLREKEFKVIPNYYETLSFVQSYCPNIKAINILN